jgi:hypothetical protein
VTKSDDPVAEIRRLYYATSKQTIVRDLARAIDLLKQLPNDEERERAAVFMDGLAQMRSEWGVSASTRPATPGRRRPQR